MFGLTEGLEGMEDVVDAESSKERAGVGCGCEEGRVFEVKQFGGKIVLHLFNYMAQSAYTNCLLLS